MKYTHIILGFCLRYKLWFTQLIYFFKYEKSPVNNDRVFLITWWSRGMVRLSPRSGMSEIGLATSGSLQFNN